MRQHHGGGKKSRGRTAAARGHGGKPSRLGQSSASKSPLQHAGAATRPVSRSTQSRFQDWTVVSVTADRVSRAFEPSIWKALLWLSHSL